MVKYAVCDWNGTLFEPPTDEDLNRAIAYARLNDAVSSIKHGKVWRAWDAGKLLSAKRQLKTRLVEYKEGKRPLAEVYEPFDRLVVHGMPARLFWSTVWNYASANLSKLDKRMIEPLHHGKQRNGILSVSQGCIIDYMLNTLSRWLDVSTFDIVSNHAEMNEAKDTMHRVTLDIYGRKGEVFEDEFLRKRGFDPNFTVYAGDTEDDLPVAGLLPRGHFVVPFYATRVFRETAASNYDAFVPKDQADWANFLEKK